MQKPTILIACNLSPDGNVFTCLTHSSSIAQAKLCTENSFQNTKVTRTFDMKHTNLPDRNLQRIIEITEKR